MRFSALFGKVFRQTALSSLQLLKDNLSGASWPCLERPLLRVTEKMQETELTVFRPYPRQEFQTICRCHSLGGSTFSSDILRLWILVQSRAWTLDLRRSVTWTNQAAVFESLLKFSHAFHHITDINTPDTIHTESAVTCHNQTQTPFDEIRKKEC